MAQQDFFTSQTDQSRVKADIVVKYFSAWATIMLKRNPRIAFADLFSGPGCYEDGNLSVPLLIIENALKNPKLTSCLITLFNDQKKEYAEKLKLNLKEIPNIDALTHQPRVTNDVVGQEFADEFNRIKMIPAIVFLDPWGYKGLSLNLINSVIQHPGCECIIFFNINRINPAINNPMVEELMYELFGKDRVSNIRLRVEAEQSRQRETIIIEEFSIALKEKYGRHVLPFKFKFDNKDRISHYLVFVTKHGLGYQIMKNVMASAGYTDIDGVPTLAYYRPEDSSQVIFNFERPYHSLGDSICSKFTGKTLTVKQIYEKHNLGTPFIKKNYKDKLLELEKHSKIYVTPDATNRPFNRGKLTMGDNVRVRFPERISDGK